MNTINILIIDDHPLTCQGYSIIINNAIEEGKFPQAKIQHSNTGEDAYKKLNSLNKQVIAYDIILLDIQIPVSAKDNIFSGEDLGLLVRELNPETKIIVHTGLMDNHRLHSIFKNLNPEGIIIKNDLDDVILMQSLSDVLSGLPFYSKTFSKLIRNQFSKDYVLNAQDRKLLYLLSIGIASKEIPNHIPWSLSKIEKRKRFLREKLGVDDKSVLALVSKAKEIGFL